MKLPTIDKVLVFILPGVINWFCCLALLIIVLLPHESVRQETSDKFLFVVLGGFSLLWTIAALFTLVKKLSKKEFILLSLPIPLFLLLCFA